MLMSSIAQLIDTYGLVVVAALICLESVALPVPGETMLILAAVFAGTHRQLNIVEVVLTAGNRLRDRPTIRLSAVSEIRRLLAHHRKTNQTR
jgi:membrane protein DedA with SNARE-associated domain